MTVIAATPTNAEPAVGELLAEKKPRPVASCCGGNFCRLLSNGLHSQRQALTMLMNARLVSELSVVTQTFIAGTMRVTCRCYSRCFPQGLTACPDL